MNIFSLHVKRNFPNNPIFHFTGTQTLKRLTCGSAASECHPVYSARPGATACQLTLNSQLQRHLEQAEDLFWISACFPCY